MNKVIPNISIGDIFNDWSVIDSPVRRGKSKVALCRCQCGTEKEVDIYTLVSNKSTRCKACMGKLYRKIDDTKLKNRIYHKWQHMMERCYNPISSEYHRYGARGITAHSNFKSFTEFLNYCVSLPGCADKDKSLDRIDNNKGYEPGNLRFATAVQQTRNRRVGLYLVNTDGSLIHYRDVIDSNCCPNTNLYFRAKYAIVKKGITTAQELKRWLNDNQ